MMAYKGILKDDTSYARWQVVNEICKHDPVIMIRRLLEKEHYEMARKVCLSLVFTYFFSYRFCCYT
jgi:hypothetical protein